MSFEMASAVVGGTDKKKYGDCTDKELSGKVLGISKELNKKDNPAERIESLKYKLDAIKTIQAYRTYKPE